MKDRNPHNLTERCELCSAWKDFGIMYPDYVYRGKCNANPPTFFAGGSYRPRTEADDFCLSMFTPLGKCRGLCKKHGTVECEHVSKTGGEQLASWYNTPKGKRRLDNLNACEQFERNYT